MQLSDFRISGDGCRCVSNDYFLLTPKDYPPPRGVDILLLTKWGKLVIGKWNEKDCSEWAPLPRRSKYRPCKSQ